jgi:hypothetical protein
VVSTLNADYKRQIYTRLNRGTGEPRSFYHY